MEVAASWQLIAASDSTKMHNGYPRRCNIFTLEHRSLWGSLTIWSERHRTGWNATVDRMAASSPSDWRRGQKCAHCKWKDEEKRERENVVWSRSTAKWRQQRGEARNGKRRSTLSPPLGQLILMEMCSGNSLLLFSSTCLSGNILRCSQSSSSFNWWNEANGVAVHLEPCGRFSVDCSLNVGFTLLSSDDQSINLNVEWGRTVKRQRSSFICFHSAHFLISLKIWSKCDGWSSLAGRVKWSFWWCGIQAVALDWFRRRIQCDRWILHRYTNWKITRSWATSSRRTGHKSMNFQVAHRLPPTADDESCDFCPAEAYGAAGIIRLERPTSIGSSRFFMVDQNGRKQIITISRRPAGSNRNSLLLRRGFLFQQPLAREITSWTRVTNIRLISDKILL